MHIIQCKPKRKPVTLIVGIVCQDGIVVAGDSQTTWGTGKSWSTNKMKEVDCVTGRALVAESGSVFTSGLVVERFCELAKNAELFNRDGLRSVAAAAVRDVRNQLQAPLFECSAEEFQEHIFRNDLECELMIAHYEDGPTIDTIKLSQGVASRAKHFFEAVGSGSDLANYVLTDLCAPGMNFNEATLIAAHVVGVAKRHDPYCGGPTKLGVLGKPVSNYSPPIIYSADQVDRINRLVDEIDKATKAKRAEVVQEAFRREAEEWRKQMDKDILEWVKTVDCSQQRRLGEA